MNKAQARDRAKIRFRDQSNHIYDNGDWDYYIESAHAEVELAADWPWRRTISTAHTTTVEQSTLTITSPEMRVRSIYNASENYPLTPVYSWEQAMNQFHDITEDDHDGKPTHYYVRGDGTIYLFPRPDAVYVLHIEFDKGTLTITETESPLWPEMYHHLLVEGALARAYADDGNAPQAEIYENRFRTILGRMMVDLVGNLEGKNVPLVDDWWG